MEVLLLLANEVYVQERFREIQAEEKQRAAPENPQRGTRQKQAHNGEGDFLCKLPHMLPSSRDDGTNDEDAVVQWQAAQQRWYSERARELDAWWPKSHLERKLTVLRAALHEMYSTDRIDLKKHIPKRRTGSEDDTTAARSASAQNAHRVEIPKVQSTMADDISPFPFQDLSLATQLGLRIFFRFCQSLQEPGKLATNSRILLQIATKLPSLLAALPPFPLSPGFAASSESPSSSLYDAEGNPRVLSVFQTLFELLSDMLNLPMSSPAKGAGTSSTVSTSVGGGLSASDHSAVLTAYIALCLKWGSLRHLLSVVYLLHDGINQITAAQLQQLEPLFLEVARAMPEIRPSTQVVEELCAGYLMSFGKGDHGKLGHGQCSHSSCAEGNCTENKCSPTMISATRDTQFIKIDSLSTHSVAITAKGDIMAWGNGDKYRLGHGATTKEYTPRTIECISSKGRVVDISCGLGHTIALMESGDLYAWGNGSNGRLGLGDTTDRSSPTKISTSELNHASQGVGNDQSQRPGNYVFRHVYCGASHSLAVGYDGRAYSWGKNNQGQCGHGHTNDQLSIQEISFFRDEVEEDIVHAAGGWEHTLFCSASGRVYSSGCGYKDSRRTGIPPVLGHGDCERRLKPTVIQLFVDIKEVIGKVACGWDHSLAVTVNGLVYSWGSGTNGKLGHGDEENCDLPTLIRAMENKRVKEAKAGCEHTVLLTEEQEVWTFGQGDSGRLGHGDNQTKKLPALIEAFSQQGLKPVAIAVGDKYNLVLAEECHGSGNESNSHSTGSKPRAALGVNGFDFHRKRRSSFLREELQKRKGSNSDSSAMQHRYGSDWILAVGESLQRQSRETEKQSEYGKLGKPIASEKNLPQLSDEESLCGDGFFPANKSECILFLLGHIDRLSSAYFCEESDQDQHIRGADDDETFTQAISHCILLPFAIDTSREVIVLLLQLLRLQCPGLSAESCKFSANEESSCSLLLHRMCVVLSCLRILKANLSKSRRAGGFACVTGTGTRMERTRSWSDLGITSAIDQIHVHINRLASAEPSEVVAFFVSRLSEQEARVLPSQCELLIIATTISQEAAHVLKVGFAYFYPSALSRRELLWELIGTQDEENALPKMKTLILTDCLCEADVMKELFLHIFDYSKMDIKCSSARHLGQLARDIQVSSPLDVRKVDAKTNRSAADLVNLMVKLLQRCSLQAINCLDATDQKASSEPSLRVLLVLQVHLFGIVTMRLKESVEINASHHDVDPCHDSCADKNRAQACGNVVESLLQYLDALFSESTIVLKKLHKASCHHEEVITWRLNRTLFDSLLPNAIEVLCVLLQLVTRGKSVGEEISHESVWLDTFRLHFVHRLLPRIHPMIKMLDEVNWKLRSDTEGSNQAQHQCDDDLLPDTSLADQPNHKWVMELQDACAILCGKLACVLTCSAAATSTIRPNHYDLFQSQVLSAGFLPSPDCDDGDRQVLDEVADMLEWEKKGVFEVENELVQTPDIESEASKACEVNSIQMLEDQRYLLDYIDSSQSCVGFASWVTAQFGENFAVFSGHERSDSLVNVAIRAMIAVVAWNCNLVAALKDCQQHYRHHIAEQKSDAAACADHKLQEQGHQLSAIRDAIKVVALSAKHSNPDVATEITASIAQTAKFLLRLQPNPVHFLRMEKTNHRIKQAASQTSFELAMNLYRLLREPIDLVEAERIVKGYMVKAALFRIGLCFYHDLLRKLTVSSAKRFLLGEMITSMQSQGSIKIHYDRSQLSTLFVQDGIAEARSIYKSIENLYIRLTKLISADDSSPGLKVKALLAWTIQFEEFQLAADAAADIVAKAGIVTILHDLLQEDADVLQSQATLNRNLPDDSAQNIQHEDVRAGEWLQLSTESTSPLVRILQKLKPVTVLLFGYTPSQSLSMVAWIAFCAIAAQLSKIDIPTHQRISPLLLPESLSVTPRAFVGKDAIGYRAAMSPRKRLTLPKRVVVATVAKSVDQVYELLYIMLTKVMHELELLACNTQKMMCLLSTSGNTSLSKSAGAANKPCEVTRALLLGNPMPISSKSTNAANFVMQSASSGAIDNSALLHPTGSTVSCWIQIDQTGKVAWQQRQRQASSEATFNPECPLLFALGKEQKASSTLENVSEVPTGSSLILADSKLAVFAYNLEEKRISIAVAFKVDEGADRTSPVDSSENNQFDTDQGLNWEVVLLDDEMQVGQWIHFALVFQDHCSALIVYVDGKAAQTKTQVKSSQAAERKVLWKTESKIKVTTGGILNEKDYSILMGGNEGECTSCTSEPRNSRNKKYQLVGVIDDLWLLDIPLTDKEIAWIHLQGPALFQLKRQHVLESHCVDILNLLCQLSQSYRLRLEKQSIIDKSVTVSSRWASLFARLLEIFPTEGQAQILLCELLQQTLPHVDSPQEIQLVKLGSSIFKQFDLARSNKVDIQETRSIRDLLLNKNGVISPRKQSEGDSNNLKENEFLSKLLNICRMHFESGNKHCIDQLLQTTRISCKAKISQNGGFAGENYSDSSFTTLSSRRFEAGVQLFQRLCNEPIWQPEIHLLLNKAAAGFTMPTDQENSETNWCKPPTYQALAIVSATVGGYSEAAANQWKAILMKESLLSVSPFSRIETPFASALKLGRTCGSFGNTVPHILRSVCAAVSSELQLHSHDTVAKNCERDTQMEIHAFDRYVTALAHCKASLLRFTMSALRNNCEDQWKNLVFDDPDAVELIFQTASVPPLELLSSVLGRDHKKALRLRSVRAVVQKLIHNGKTACRKPFSSLLQLEALAWEVWETTHARAVNGSPSSFWWQEKISHRYSPLEVVGGEVEIRHMTVKALEHFPTIRLSNVGISVNTGLWFYEVHVLSDGLMQIGYIDADFVADPIQGQGVGDHTNSWGFDGFRCKKWNISSSDYGEPWRADDVVGVLLDTDRMELSFFLNGKFLGVAFSGLPMTPSSNMCPAASLNVNQIAQFNFGFSARNVSGQEHPEQMLSFAHIPALDSEQDQNRLQPVAIAIPPADNEKNECSDLISEGDNNVTDLGEESENNDDCSPSSDDDGDGEAETQAMQLPNALYSIDGINSNAGHAHDLMESRENSESAIENSAVVAERNDLIEGLIGLGFPPEWAIRCATETNLSINESGAVTWILEQMEKDATAGVGHGSVDASAVDGSGVQSLLGKMFNVRDLTSSRSADDLSLISSISTSSGHGMLTLPSAHHGLYPNQGFRPHTEQLSRNRIELFSDLQASKQHFSNSTTRKSVSGETNPFLIAEQHALILEDDTTAEPFPSQDYSVQGQESFTDSILLRQAMSAHSRSILECASIDLRAAEVEAIPLCLTLDSMLSRIYARQSLYYLLTSEDHLPAVFSLVSRWSSNADSFRRLIRFMRGTIGLEKQELLIEIEDLAGMAGAAEQSTRLQKTMQMLLRMEIERSTQSESGAKASEMVGSFPIFHAMFSELKNQCTQAISLQGSERSETKVSCATVDGTARSVLWTLWIGGIIFTEVETQAVLAQKALECFSSAVATTCYSLSFFQTLVTIASSPSYSSMPWKLAAFGMIKRILCGVSRIHCSIQDKVSIEGPNSAEQCLQPLSWTSDSLARFRNAAQIPDILDLFALRYHKEKASRVFFSSLTRVVFGVVVRFLDFRGDQLQSESSPLSMLEGEEALVEQEDLDFAIESFSSTHATVSWNHRVTGPEGAVEDQDTTTSFVHTLLSLSVIQEKDPFHGDVADATEHLPRVLPSKGSFTVRNLMPDTRYVFRLVPVQTMVNTVTSLDDDGNSSSHPQTKSAAAILHGTQSASGQTLYFQTPPEPLFELDAESMGKNLVLFNRNLSVKNLMNKKWHTVRASVGFDEGIHQWHVRIDTCVSKNIFIGVCTAQASLENYIGSDGFGYGFLANKAVWHNKSKLHAYGEIFKQGDLLQVTLDCNAKTLAFSRNGEYLGIAASNLHVANSYASTSSLNESSTCKWYPAFSMYNKDDQLTIIPPSSGTMLAKPEQLQHASILGVVEAMQFVEAYQANIGHGANKIESSKECSLKMYKKAFSDFQKWKMGELVFRELCLGQFIGIESSEETARKFGFSKGDFIFTSKGQATVLGEYNHELWYEVDYRSNHNATNASAGLDSWNLHACKQMLASPSEFPVHRYATHNPLPGQIALDKCQLGHHHSRNDEMLAGDLQVGDEASSFDQFHKFHQTWNQNPSISAVDEKLIQILDHIASSRAVSDPQHLSFLDIRAAFVTDGIMTPLLSLVSTLSPSTMASFSQIMNRIGLLLYVNRSLYRVIRLVLSKPMRSALLPTSLQNALNRDKCEDKGKQDDDQDDESPHVNKKKKMLFLHTIAVSESIAALISNIQWIHLDPSDFGPGVDRLGTRLLFRSQKERLIQEALKKTATPTLTSSVNDLQNQSNEFVNHLDDSYDPSELPRMRVHFRGTPQCVPFWKLPSFAGSNLNSAIFSSESWSQSVFIQVSQQLQALPSREWRRAYASPFEPMPVTRTFHVVVESTSHSSIAWDKAKHNVSNDALDVNNKPSADVGGLQEKNESQQTQPPVLSQTTRYLQLLEHVMIELQSPVFPLFVPTLSNKTKQHAEDHDEEQLLQSRLSWDAIDSDQKAEARNLELDLNLPLFSPFMRAHHDALSSERVLLWYFQFGQLLGIAWRGGILLPLQFISKSFWEDLANPVPVVEAKPSTQSERSDERVRLTVLHAIRDGLFSIVPSCCLALLPAQELRQCVSDTSMLTIRSLQRHALYNNECAHHKTFWDLVHEFTSLERRALLVFLTGAKPNKFAHESDPYEATEGTQQPFVVELSDAPLSDSQGNPDACYPVAVLVSDRQSRVHIPAYSSAAVMRKKLTQAMVSAPPQQF